MLEMAIRKARQSKTVHQQQPLLRGNKQELEELPVGAIVILFRLNSTIIIIIIVIIIT